MGAAASSQALVALLPKTSDDELKQTLAGLDAESKARLLKALENAPNWKSCYGVLGMVAFKDQTAARKLIEADAMAQVKEESRSPSFTVMGLPTATTDGYDAPPEALTANKVGWLAFFDDKASYHDGEHKERTEKNNFHKEMFAATLTGNLMADFFGGFMGHMIHIDKTGQANQGGYTVVVIAKAKDAESRANLIELLKDRGLTQLRDEEGALRFTILTGSETPGDDPLALRWVEQWASSADHEAHKKSTHELESAPKVKTLVSEMSIVEFAKTNHYEAGQI